MATTKKVTFQLFLVVLVICIGSLEANPSNSELSNLIDNHPAGVFGFSESVHPEVRWILEELKPKAETNGAPSWVRVFPCFSIATTTSWLPGIFVVVFGGLFAGLPLGFFIPIVPYFDVPNWLPTTCTSIEPGHVDQRCSKNGCRWFGVAKVRYNVGNDTLLGFLYTDPVPGAATIDYQTAINWVNGFMPYNQTVCYYNPKDPSLISEYNSLAWYYYLYAIFIGPFVLVGVCLFLSGVVALIGNALKSKEVLNATTPHHESAASEEAIGVTPLDSFSPEPFNATNSASFSMTNSGVELASSSIPPAGEGSSSSSDGDYQRFSAGQPK